VEEDVPTLAQVLARAFFDDPVACWSCPSPVLRGRMLERFHAVRLRQALLASEDVWTSSGLEGAAVWFPPGRSGTTVREDLELARSVALPQLAWRLPLVLGGFVWGIERFHPAEPLHWYLAVLGTEPVAQGRGVGSALLGPVLDRCDKDGVGAYLESSKERNIAFYARHGFRVVRELRLPRGPRMWGMWRGVG
jgi:ribosomal protein S18 acetylase RimI-like enzyme